MVQYFIKYAETLFLIFMSGAFVGLFLVAYGWLNHKYKQDASIFIVLSVACFIIILSVVAFMYDMPVYEGPARRY